MPRYFFIICDILALAVINIILWSSLYIQFVQHELPCPLCLLQRMGMISIGFGYLLNLYFGSHSRHYAIGAIAGILTAITAMIQILLHIVPETGNYGSPLFGLHLYTWSFVFSTIFILFNLLLICLLKTQASVSKIRPKFAGIVMIPLGLCIIINIISAFAECGIEECPADPTSYWISKFLEVDVSKKH